MSWQVTTIMKRALEALREHGGTGVITNRGTLLAGGVELGDYEGEHLVSAYSSATWLRLVASGLVEGRGEGRLEISKAA